MSELSTDKLIFVTGASGFLASHNKRTIGARISYQSMRPWRKFNHSILKALYNSSSRLEIVEIADITHGNYEDLLRGVNAVIHTAFPLPGRACVETMMRTGIDGSLNILKQAKNVGVKKFVITGTIAAVIGDPSVQGVSYRAEHWNPITKEDSVLFENSEATYSAAKKFAELAVWEWADANPETDVTVFNPPLMYGSFAPLHLSIAPGDFNLLSTNINIYNLLFPTGKFPHAPRYVDFQDIAKAHVGALRTPATVKGRKRVLFSSPYGLDFSNALETIRKARPDLEGRFIQSPIPHFAFDKLDLDFERIEEITGMKKGKFQTTEKTILAAVDALIDMENTWLKAGYILPDVIPTLFP